MGDDTKLEPDQADGKTANRASDGKITPDTLIAEVADYAIELASRERAEAVRANPDQTWMPKWLAIVLLAVLLGTLGCLFTLMTGAPASLIDDSPLRTATLVLVGVSAALIVFTLLLRAERYGRLPDERMKELMELNDSISKKFEELGSKCYGCGAAYSETFATGAKVCGMDVDKWVSGLNELGLDLRAIRQPIEATATTAANSSSDKSA